MSGTSPRPAGRVLVLGGTGFVGRAVCAELAARGVPALSAARNPAPAQSPEVRPVRLDLGTRSGEESLLRLLDTERPDAVVHCVGSIWGRTAEEMVPSIVTPTRRLIAALARSAARPRLVHLGSVLEYGPVTHGTTAHGPERPDTPYGKAKYAATRAVLAAREAGTVDALVLRIANVSGPGTPAVGLLGRVADQLTGPFPAEVELSPLRAHRDYVDVRDVACAVVAALDPAVPADGRIVDIGRGEAVSVRELVELFVEVSGVGAKVVERGETRAAADWMRVDPGPARELLGWRPRRTLEESLRSYWRERAATSPAL